MSDECLVLHCEGNIVFLFLNLGCHTFSEVPESMLTEIANASCDRFPQSPLCIEWNTEKFTSDGNTILLLKLNINWHTSPVKRCSSDSAVWCQMLRLTQERQGCWLCKGIRMCCTLIPVDHHSDDALARRLTRHRAGTGCRRCSLPPVRRPSKLHKPVRCMEDL